jgi:hypothetical protein
MAGKRGRPILSGINDPAAVRRRQLTLDRVRRYHQRRRDAASIAARATPAPSTHLNGSSLPHNADEIDAVAGLLQLRDCSHVCLPPHPEHTCIRPQSTSFESPIEPHSPSSPPNSVGTAISRPMLFSRTETDYCSRRSPSSSLVRSRTFDSGER